MGLVRVATEKGMFSSEGLPVSASGMMEHAVSIETILNDILNGEQAISRALFTDASTLTINISGTLPIPTLAQHLVSAYSGSSDSLDSITALNNTMVLLKATAGHTITIRHGVGNIWTMSGLNITLTGNRAVLAVCNGGQWAVLAGSRALMNVTTVDPRAGDDRLDGYSTGSIWVNTTRGRAWMCFDASTAGAAVWGLISRPLNEWSVRATAANTVAGEGCAATVGGAGGTTTLDADGTWLSLTSASVGTPATIYSGTAPNLGQTRWNYEPVWETLIKTGGDLTSQRLWVALIDSAGVVDADTLTNPALAFRYSTVAGDTRFRPIAFDGTTQQTGNSIGTALAINTVYKLRMRVATSGAVTVYFSVNDSAEETITTNLPLNTQDLVLHIAMYPQVASSRSLLFGRTKVVW